MDEKNQIEPRLPKARNSEPTITKDDFDLERALMKQQETEDDGFGSPVFRSAPQRMRPKSKKMACILCPLSWWLRSANRMVCICRETHKPVWSSSESGAEIIIKCDLMEKALDAEAEKAGAEEKTEEPKPKIAEEEPKTALETEETDSEATEETEELTVDAELIITEEPVTEDYDEEPVVESGVTDEEQP